MKNRNPIFQIKNQFPGRYIEKPNLLKTRYFQSGRATPEGSERGEEISERDFDIEGVIEGKQMKKKKSPIKLKDTGDFDPFGTKKNKKIDDSQQNFKQTTKERSSTYVKETINPNETGSKYIKEKEFYEKMLEEDNYEEDQQGDYDKRDNKEESKQTFIKKPTPIDDKHPLEGLITLDCALCRSASFMDAKIRNKKNVNPSLVEPHEIKYLK